jgi:hypothetical protein
LAVNAAVHGVNVTKSCDARTATRHQLLTLHQQQTLYMHLFVQIHHRETKLWIQCESLCEATSSSSARTSRSHSSRLTNYNKQIKSKSMTTQNQSISYNDTGKDGSAAIANNALHWSNSARSSLVARS